MNPDLTLNGDAPRSVKCSCGNICIQLSGRRLQKFDIIRIVKHRTLLEKEVSIFPVQDGSIQISNPREASVKHVVGMCFDIFCKCANRFRLFATPSNFGIMQKLTEKEQQDTLALKSGNLLNSLPSVIRQFISISAQGTPEHGNTLEDHWDCDIDLMFAKEAQDQVGSYKSMPVYADVFFM